MENMTVIVSPFLTSFVCRRWLAALLAIVGITAAAVKQADAYSLNGKSWVSGSNIVLQLSLGNAPAPLADGNTSWNAAILPVLDMWNARVSRIRLSGVMDSTAPASSGDRVNSVVFSNSVFGQSFGTGTLAVTYYIMQGSALVEADVLFNRVMTFDSYRGGLRFGGQGGYALADIRRVFLHELGHGLGPNHSEGDNIMDALISDREALSGDDIAGIQALYGAPAPKPTPTPVPTPTATPTPTPSAAPSHLVNISTRMKVGLDQNVLIGGFIIQGTQNKRLILRATGPSLAGVINGVLTDPVLELYDGTGQLIAENDNWQSGGQVAQITTTGVAPGHGAEAALVVSLAPGNYTAIVRGANRTQGVALIEGYELDSTSTRLVNLSTRGRIGLGEEVLIGGLIVQGSSSKRVIIRALGPSMAAAISGALANPVLELYNSSGTQITLNDNWSTSPQRDEIIATTVPPPNALESAIVATLAPGSYTAIVRGASNGTGVGLVEVYDLQP